MTRRAYIQVPCDELWEILKKHMYNCYMEPLPIDTTMGKVWYDFDSDSFKFGLYSQEFEDIPEAGISPKLFTVDRFGVK